MSVDDNEMFSIYNAILIVFSKKNLQNYIFNNLCILNNFSIYLWLCRYDLSSLALCCQLQLK